MKFYGLSDIGLSRPTNQDVWIAEPDLGFFALADGIGGRKGGELAAQQTIASLSTSIRRLAERSNYFQNAIDLSQNLRSAIEYANASVHNLGKQAEHTMGMGSTLCCLLWTQEQIYYAHVGDSRIYRFRDNQLALLTRDHSLLERWMARKEKNLPSPPKNIITRAMGMSGRANPEISCCPMLRGDLFLLCSDGLSDAVRIEELEEMIRTNQSLEEIAQTMIHSAKNMGSNDNITVLMVRL